MYTTFLSLVHQSPFHCRAGQSSPGKGLCRGSCTLGTNHRRYFGSYTLHFLLMFSIFHSEQLESSRESTQRRQVPSCVAVRSGQEGGREWDSFFQGVWQRYCYWHGFWLECILANQGNPSDPKVGSPATAGSLHNQ